jgi:hypothetical protein
MLHNHSLSPFYLFLSFINWLLQFYLPHIGRQGNAARYGKPVRGGRRGPERRGMGRRARTGAAKTVWHTRSGAVVFPVAGAARSRRARVAGSTGLTGAAESGWWPWVRRRRFGFRGGFLCTCSCKFWFVFLWIFDSWFLWWICEWLNDWIRDLYEWLNLWF